MAASPMSDTVAKIEHATDRRELKHLDRLGEMLDDDGTLYDWSEDDIKTLAYARRCICKLREIRRSIGFWVVV